MEKSDLVELVERVFASDAYDTEVIRAATAHPLAYAACRIKQTLQWYKEAYQTEHGRSRALEIEVERYKALVERAKAVTGEGK